MAIGLTDDQRALASSLTDWVEDSATVGVVRAAGEDGPGHFGATWDQLAQLGVVGIALPESVGGGGGTLVDLACALEVCARGLVPGPLLSTAIAATLLAEQPGSLAAKRLLPGVVDGSVTIALAPELLRLTRSDDGMRLSGAVPVVWDAGSTTHLLAGTGHGAEEEWFLVETACDGVEVEAARKVDLSRSVGTVQLDEVAVGAEHLVPLEVRRVRDVAATLAAAEAAGIAGWALDTAVDHAKVREQFGRTIGSFQSIKHLCAQMLERAESATAVAWDAASAHSDTRDQFAFASAVAAAVGLDAAVDNVKDCIQILGGTGFTWEHDAHLYLRRAISTRQLLGSADHWRLRCADQALAGHRRTVRIDLDRRVQQQASARVREQVAQIAALSADERRARLAETGLLAPHWPAPYGLGAGAVEQLVIDEELAAAGVQRPDLAIGGWAVPTLLASGTDEQKDRFVADTLRGRVTWCQLFSEPGSGSDLASLRTRAERVDGGWRLSGQKVWTSLANEASWGICLARTNPDAVQHKGITYFLVDMRSAGIDIRPLRELTGEAVFNEVFLDKVFVPDDCVVGEVDGGWPLARSTLANERVAMSGSSLGASVERSLATVLARRDSGDGVRLRLGAAVAEASTVTTLGTRATLRLVEGQGPGPESSVQKLVGVRHRQDAAELAFELIGPGGLLPGAKADDAVHELLLTRCLSIAGGTTQILRNVVGERILGLPRESR